MKEPLKQRSRQSVSKKDSDLPVSGKNDVQQFLSKVAAMPKTGGDARLIFALDATASRESTWDVASQLQTEMFLSTHSLGGLNVSVGSFNPATLRILVNHLLKM